MIAPDWNEVFRQPEEALTGGKHLPKTMLAQ